MGFWTDANGVVLRDADEAPRRCHKRPNLDYTQFSSRPRLRADGAAVASLPPRGPGRGFGFVAVLWLLASAVLFVSLAGCGLPDKAREQMRIDAAASDRITDLWPRMTPEQRSSAYQKLREGNAVIRYVDTGELPEDELLRARLEAMLGGEE